MEPLSLSFTIQSHGDQRPRYTDGNRHPQKLESTVVRAYSRNSAANPFFVDRLLFRFVVILLETWLRDQHVQSPCVIEAITAVAMKYHSLADIGLELQQ